MAKTKISVSIDEGLIRRLERKVDGKIVRSFSGAVELYLEKGLAEAPIDTAVILLRKKDFPVLFRKIDGKTLFEHHLAFLEDNRIMTAFFVTAEDSHGKTLVTSLGERAVKVEFIYEAKEEGNVAALRHVKDLVSGPFLVIYGDTYFSFDISNMARKHMDSRSVVTAGLYGERPQKTSSTIRLDGDSIVEFRKGEVKDSLIVDIGIYVYSPEAFDHMKDSDRILEKDLFPRLCKEGLMRGYFVPGKHKHLGEERWE